MNSRPTLVNKRHSYINKLIPFVIALMLLAALVSPLAAQPPEPSLPTFSADEGGPGYAPGEILVKFKPAVGQPVVQTTLAGQGLQVAGAIQAIDVLKVAVEPGQELETIAALGRDPNVLYAEPNYFAHALETNPNDEYYTFDYQWALDKISAPAAWDVTTGSGDLIIAVVDTGIDLDHPDLSCPGKLMAGDNFVTPGQPPDDDYGHGTHVAGIAAACTNNDIGVAGLAWGARLMPVKVLDSHGDGTYDQVADGIIYAVDQGADIINLSLGGSEGSYSLAEAVQYANDHGRLVVAAVGNYSGPVLYPAAYPEAMAVAATNSFDQRAAFSNYGPETDVAAPGVTIFSTYIGAYGYSSGTSMSTPYVAGLAALVWSLYPGLSQDQVRHIIQTTADDLGAPGRDDYYGHGRINAWRALGTLVNLQTFPAEVNFLIDDDSGPYPPWATVQLTTGSTDPLTWTATISPSVTWLDVAPPSSGTVSAASPDSFTLVVPGRPTTYGSFDTTAIVTGATSSGGVVGWATTNVHITYVPDLDQTHLPIIVKNALPN